jgi:hypothetical protein
LFGTGRREGCLAVLLLIALAVVIHAPGLMLGRPRLAHEPLDPAAPARETQVNESIVLPALARAGEVVRGGELPLWNRDARLGEPFSVTGAPVLYPPFWLLMLRGGSCLLDFVMFLHTALACLCTYRFLRAASLGRYVAFLGAGMYGFGWFLTSQMDRLPSAAAAALVPLALELTWRVTVYGKARLAPLLGLSVALLFATGGTSIAVFGTGVCAALFAARMFVIDREDRVIASKRALLAGAVAVLLTAPLWLDAWQNHGACAEPLSADGAHLQPAGLIGLCSPLAFGTLPGAGPLALLDLNPGADPLELVLYPGALALFLVFLGLLRPKRTWAGLFWILIGGLGLLLALDSPLHALVQDMLGWHLGLPGAALLLAHLGFVVLACVSLENFFDAPAARAFAVPLTASLALLAVAVWLVTGVVHPALGEAAVAALTGSDDSRAVGSAARHLRAALAPVAIGLALIASLFFVWRRLGMLRFKACLAVVALGELLVVAAWAPPRAEPAQRSTAFAEHVPHGEGRFLTVGGAKALPGSAAMAAGVATLNTDADAILARTALLLRLLEHDLVEVGPRARVRPLRSASSLAHPVLALAGIGTAAGPRPVRGGGFEPLVAAPGGAAPGGSTVHVATRRAGPRARIVYDATLVDSPTDAGKHMAHAQWPFEQTVFVEGADPAFTTKCLGAEARAEIRSETANATVLHVAMGKERGYLVLSEAYAPGWTATVDGKSTKVLPADVALCAIPLAEGDHVVELRYAPWSARFGLPILGVGLLVVLALTVQFKRRK